MKISTFFNLPAEKELDDEAPVWVLTAKFEGLKERLMSDSAYTTANEAKEHLWWKQKTREQHVMLERIPLKNFIAHNMTGMNMFWTLGAIKNVVKRYR